MKKYLSLVLAVALVLTTLVVPAYADDLSLDGTNEVTLTYEVASVNGESEVDAIYPKDEVVVNAVLSTASETPISIGDIDITTDVGGLTDVTLTAEGEFENESTDNDSLHFADANLTGVSVSASAPLTLFTLSFEAPTTIGDYNITVDAVALNFVMSGIYECDVTVVDEKVTVSNVVNTVKVGDKALEADAEAAYVYANSADVTFTSTSKKASAKFTAVPEGSNVTVDTVVTDAATSVTTVGTYAITVTNPDGSEAVYTFELKGAVAATLATEVSNVKETGNIANDQIVVRTSISGLSEGVQVSYLTYGVTYDADVFDLAVDGAQLRDGTIVWGEDNANEDNYLTSNQTNIATLTFTVKADAAYGKHDIAFEEGTTTIYNDLSGNDNKLGAADTISVAVVPETYATLTETNIPAEGSYATSYTVPVAVTEGVTTKLYMPETPQDVEGATQETLASWYTAATQEIANGVEVNVNTEGQYILISTTAAGIYTAVEITNRVDITGPTAAKKENVDVDWTSTKDEVWTVDSADFATVEDTKSGVATKVEYYFGDVTEGIVWNTSEDGKITQAIGTNYNGNLAIRYFDDLGNASDNYIDVTVKLDGEAPALSDLACDGTIVNNKQTVTFTATDFSGIQTVEIYKDGVIDAGIEYTNEGNDYTFGVATEGTYTVKVYDAVNHVSEKSIAIEFAEKTVREVKVSVLNGVEPTYKLNNTIEMAEKGIAPKGSADAYDTNGTFTYAKVEIVDFNTVNGFTDTLTVEKSVAGVVDEEFVAPDDGVYTEVGDYTLTVSTTQDGITDDEPLARTYKFSIVAADDINTVNGNHFYDISDYARVRNVLGKTTNTAIPESGDLFYGGYYSGDLNGDFAYSTADDLTPLLGAILGRNNTPSDNNFGILNNTTSGN